MVSHRNEKVNKRPPYELVRKESDAPKTTQDIASPCLLTRTRR